MQTTLGPPFPVAPGAGLPPCRSPALAPGADAVGEDFVIVQLERGMVFARAADAPNSDCAICLEKLHEFGCVRLACGHWLHWSCARAMERYALIATGDCRCPICRAVVSQVVVVYDRTSAMLRKFACDDGVWGAVNRRVVWCMLESDMRLFALPEAQQVTMQRVVPVLEYASQASVGELSRLHEQARAASGQERVEDASERRAGGKRWFSTKQMVSVCVLLSCALFVVKMRA
jgi:hypothetical protein